MAVIDELVGILGFDFKGKDDVKRYKDSLKGVETRMVATGQQAIKLGGLLKAAFIGIATGKAVSSAIKFEEAVADIKKVVDGTPEQFADLESELLKMSRSLPVSADGLANIAASAGETGVALGDLTKFTEQVALAVVAFDLPAEKVGKTMAELSNVFGFNVEEMGKFNDTANHLSNNLSAKAGQILDFTNRAAGAARQLGLTADQLAGVGAALIAAGVVPETAARGLKALGTRIQAEAKGVDEALQSVGLSAKGFKEALAVDGDAAIVDLFNKLSTLDISEQTVALKALVGQDFSGDFSKLVNNPELLSRALGLANDEAGKLGSVAGEAAARAETTAAKWERIKGIVNSVAIIAAGPLLDAFGKVADFVFKIVEAFDSADTTAQGIANVLNALGFDASAAKIQEWITAFTQGFTELKTFIQPIFDSITTFISATLSDAITSLNNLFQTINFEAVGETIKAVANSLVTVFDQVLANAQKNFQAVKDAFSQIFASINFESILNTVSEMELLDSVMATVSAGLEASSAIFQAVASTLGTAISTIISNFTDFDKNPALSGLAERIGPLFEKIKGVFDGLTEALANPLVQSALTQISAVIGEVVSLFATLVGNSILTSIELMATAIGTLVDVFNLLIQGDFSGALQRLFGGLGEMMGTIAGSLNTILTAIFSTLQRVSEISFGGIFEGFQQEFADFLQNTLNFFVDKINEVISQLPEFIAGKVGLAKLERFDFADSEEEKAAAKLAAEVENLKAQQAQQSEVIIAERDAQVAALQAVTDEIRQRAIEDLGGLDALKTQAEGNIDGQGRFEPGFRFRGRIDDEVENIIAPRIEQLTADAIQKVNSDADAQLAALGETINSTITELENATKPVSETVESVDGSDSVQPTTEPSEIAEPLAKLTEASQAATEASQQQTETLNGALSEIKTVVETQAAATPPTQAVPPAATQVATPIQQPAVAAGAQVQSTSAVSAAIEGLKGAIAAQTPALSQMAAAASAISAMTFAPELIEQTINNDYTKNITNNITNSTTVNQTVTGATAPASAGNAANNGASRGTQRGLAVNNHGADG